MEFSLNEKFSSNFTSFCRGQKRDVYTKNCIRKRKYYKQKVILRLKKCPIGRRITDSVWVSATIIFCLIRVAFTFSLQPNFVFRIKRKAFVWRLALHMVRRKGFEPSRLVGTAAWRQRVCRFTTSASAPIIYYTFFRLSSPFLKKMTENCCAVNYFWNFRFWVCFHNSFRSCSDQRYV